MGEWVTVFLPQHQVKRVGVMGELAALEDQERNTRHLPGILFVRQSTDRSTSMTKVG